MYTVNTFIYTYNYLQYKCMYTLYTYTLYMYTIYTYIHIVHNILDIKVYTTTIGI